MKKYTILSARGVRGAATRASGLRPMDIADTSLVITKLAPAEAARIARRDPSVIALAPVMPIVAIRPRLGPEVGADAIDWGVRAVKADESVCDGRGVTVAVLDTGIDTEHPAFAGVDLVRSNFTDGKPEDIEGHGTHCAGTIFGRDVDGVRIGVARGVTRALIGKVLHEEPGKSDSAGLFAAVDWAVREGAHVISMSLGFDFPGAVAELVADRWPIELATSVVLDEFRANLKVFEAHLRLANAVVSPTGGSVVVAASGNESRREVDRRFVINASLPSSAEGALSIAALAPASNGLFGVADFSNRRADLSAPGVGVRSAKVGGGLATFSGTSMATPHAAGVAALWWQSLRAVGARVDAATVSAKMIATARGHVISEQFGPLDFGHGLVTAPP